METITRVFEFDAAHRIMNERVKCFNLHGHRFKVEVTFSYNSKGSLGYAMDFKEIKRIVGDWIDEKLDHACILNPNDEQLIALCRSQKWKLHVMGMGAFGDINPSAENMASELFYIIGQLFVDDKSGVRIVRVRLYETPNCWVETDTNDYVGTVSFINELKEWRKERGSFNYDARVKE
jgi:6-pyruvoyltetrahydropterin/6-carboxytetrahydropterin synthase